MNLGVLQKMTDRVEADAKQKEKEKKLKLLR
jgi:hypothetical protein